MIEALLEFGLTAESRRAQRQTSSNLGFSVKMSNDMITRKAVFIIQPDL